MLNNSKTKSPLITTSIPFAIIILAIFLVGIATCSSPPRSFDGSRALADIEYQLSLGPRIPGSAGHAQFVEWALEELEGQGWSTWLQETTAMGHPIRNVIAMRGQRDHPVPWYILGAHYDTRIYADNDPDPEKRYQPVSGANDGASGVAVLLELARTIPSDYPAEIWLVFFDAEDNGRIPGWDWILGSKYLSMTSWGDPTLSLSST